MTKPEIQQFVVCINNEGYEASLEKRKIYVVKVDADAAKHGLVRVVDESEEDYLYPSALFQPISLSATERKAILAA
jgi:hypothetical protein